MKDSGHRLPCPKVKLDFQQELARFRYKCYIIIILHIMLIVQLDNQLFEPIFDNVLHAVPPIDEIARKHREY